MLLVFGHLRAVVWTPRGLLGPFHDAGPRERLAGDISWKPLGGARLGGLEVQKNLDVYMFSECFRHLHLLSQKILNIYLLLFIFSETFKIQTYSSPPPNPTLPQRLPMQFREGTFFRKYRDLPGAKLVSSELLSVLHMPAGVLSFGPNVFDFGKRTAEGR